jgi:hypothetical protein
MHFTCISLTIYYTEKCIRRKFANLKTICILYCVLNNNNDSTALVCEQTTPTERPVLVGEVSFNFLWIEGCHAVKHGISPMAIISIF